MILEGNAVVTGGSSGIGLAIAKSLAAEGMRLHLVGRSQDKLDEAVATVSSTGGEVLAHSLDLTNDSEVARFCDELRGDLDGLELLIHSAGTVKVGPVRELEVASLDEQYRLNLRAPYLLTQSLLPLLESAQGQIVFINSGAGLNANATWSQYAATKHGLKALADSLRGELGASGVRVISVYPGRTASPMQQSVREMEGQAYKPDDFIQPEDIAQQLLSALKMARSAVVTDLVIRPA